MATGGPVNSSSSFVRLHLLLSESLPEQLLVSELAAFHALLWKDALYPDQLKMMKKVWTDLKHKAPYQHLANQLDIADQLAVYIMVTSYYVDMRVGENIPKFPASKFPNELISNFFIYYLHEKLYKIKSIKKLISLALERKHPLNSCILVYLNSDKIPDILPFLWKKYTSLEILKYKPYLSPEEEASCIAIYYRQHIEWLAVVILFIHRFPDKAVEGILKEIITFLLKNSFLHPSCTQLHGYQNTAFTVKSILYFSILLSLKCVCLLADKGAINEKVCRDFFKLIVPNEATCAPFVLTLTMLLKGVLLIGDKNVRNLGGEAILGGALVSLEDLVKFRLFQRCEHLRNIVGLILTDVLFKLLDNFEIEPIGQTNTIFSLATNGFAACEMAISANNLSIMKSTILAYCFDSFPVFFKPMMEFLCALVATLSAKQMYGMLGSLDYFNTLLAGDISNSEETDRYLTDTTEIIKSRSCLLCIPGETYGRIVEWSGDTYIKWEFVFSAWMLFIGRLELFVDELTVSSEDIEKAGMILKLVDSILTNDKNMFSELNVFCSLSPGILSRAISLNLEEKADLIIHSIGLISFLCTADTDSFLQEMTDANTFGMLEVLSVSIINNPASLTRDNTKLFNIILSLLELFGNILTRDPKYTSESFSLSFINFLQQLLRHSIPISDNEYQLKVHTRVFSLLIDTQQLLQDWKKSENKNILDLSKTFSTFFQQENSIIELLFFDFNILKRLMESQQSDFLRGSCTSLLELILKLLTRLLETFDKAYFKLMESYIVRPDNSLIHVLSDITMSLHGSQLTLSTLSLMRELCRHSDFSLMVCLGRTANALKSSLTIKLRSPTEMVSSNVQIEILRFTEQVLKYQPSFAEFIFSRDDQNIVSNVVELLDKYGKDRVHAGLLAACLSLLTVIWVTRRDCIREETLTNLWKYMKVIMPLFYRKNMEYTEQIIELTQGVVTVMMIEFYNSLFIEKIDPNFKESILCFLNDTFLENYFNLAFTTRQERTPNYSRMQTRFAVALKQFVSILTVKAHKIDFIDSYFDKTRKKFVIEVSFDQLDLMVKNNHIYEVEDLFSELMLVMVSLLKNWADCIDGFHELFNSYVSVSTWLVSVGNVACLPFKYYLTGSLLLLQNSLSRHTNLNRRSKDSSSLPMSLLFTNIITVFSEIMRSYSSVEDSLHELVILNLSEILHQDCNSIIFDSVETTPLYFLIIECLKRSAIQNKLNLTNSYLLLLLSFSKYEVFAKSQDLSLYFQVVSDLLYSCSSEDMEVKQSYHEIWCTLLDLLSTCLISGKHNFLNEAKYYLDGVRFINEINANISHCNSLLVLKENYHLAMLLLHLSKVQNYQINLPFDHLALSLIRIIEVCIELLLHTDKLTRICINTEDALQSESKARLISEEISDVFSDRSALIDKAKLWLIKTLRVALTSLHILTPSVEQILSYPTSDYMVYCFIYNFQQPQSYNRLIQPVSALCSCLTVSLELLNKIPAKSPNQNSTNTNEFVKKRNQISSFSWVKNFIEITLSLILSQSCMVILSPVPQANKQLFKIHVSGEIENFLLSLLRVLNRKNIQTTPSKRRSRLTCSLSVQSTGDSLSIKSSSLGFGDHPDQIFFMTVDNLRKHIF